MIAGFDTCYALTCLADDACSLVTENDRRFHRPVAAGGVQVAVADPGRANFD
jgi:hypothetical protein